MSSGLYHLVEAATVLSQLVGSTVNHQQVPTSTSPLSTESVSLPSTSFSRRQSSHTISDDDDMASTKMATLRENHLQALRAAATSASLPAPVSAYTATLAPPATVVSTSIQASTLPQNVQVTTTTRVPRSDSKEIFPMRLHALLADPTVRDVISWLPHGKSFVVLRPDVFATRVLPRYFAPEGSNSLNAKKTTSSNVVANTNKAQGVHKYPSFTRKLNRWGFRQISRGPDAGAFCHELFQRDDPELCRRMICQKSRKSKKSPQHPMASSAANSGGYSDDMMSVSSASTMSVKSVASNEKRPYSSTVTVSTAGATSNKSLPFKKRKSGQHIMMNGIPAMISHRNQSMNRSNQSMNRASGAGWSVTESDLTSSDNGSVSSVNQVAASVAQSVPQAPVAPEASSVAGAANTTAAPISAEAAAREALARHFHEQHRAFALASLMENSRLAMAAVGIPEASTSVATASSATLSQHHVGESSTAPVLGAMTTHSPSVFAPTVYSAGMNPQPSTAEAAKTALYKAYLQALSSSR